MRFGRKSTIAAHRANSSGDRDLDCEAELLEHFRALVERALKAGWAEDEIANALLSLAELYAMDLEDGAVIKTRVLQ